MRKGKITGTGLKKIVGTAAARNKYFYELLAERLVIDDGQDVSPMERGADMEDMAIEFFEVGTGKIVDKIGFITRDDNSYIASSPDGLIKNKGKYTEAIEVKCPSSAVYLEAWLENAIPKEYYPQVIQYFIVNEDLKTLYFVLFDPRVTVHPMHIIEVKRAEIEETIEEYRLAEEIMLTNVENKLAKIIDI